MTWALKIEEVGEKRRHKGPSLVDANGVMCLLYTEGNAHLGAHHPPRSPTIRPPLAPSRAPHPGKQGPQRGIKRSVHTGRVGRKECGRADGILIPTGV